MFRPKTVCQVGRNLELDAQADHECVIQVQALKWMVSDDDFTFKHIADFDNAVDTVQSIPVNAGEDANIVDVYLVAGSHGWCPDAVNRPGPATVLASDMPPEFVVSPCRPVS